MSSAGRVPLYPRVLRLRNVHPNAWQRAALGEGALAVAGVLVLADLATAWTLLALPVAVAAVVKAHDVVAGMLGAGPRASGTAPESASSGASDNGGSAGPESGSSAAPDNGGSAAPDNGGSAAPDNASSAAPESASSAAPDNGGSAAPDNDSSAAPEGTALREEPGAAEPEG